MEERLRQFAASTRTPPLPDEIANLPWTVQSLARRRWSFASGAGASGFAGAFGRVALGGARMAATLAVAVGLLVAVVRPEDRRIQRRPGPAPTYAAAQLACRAADGPQVVVLPAQRRRRRRDGGLHRRRHQPGRGRRRRRRHRPAGHSGWRQRFDDAHRHIAARRGSRPSSGSDRPGPRRPAPARSSPSRRTWPTWRPAPTSAPRRRWRPAAATSPRPTATPRPARSWKMPWRPSAASPRSATPRPWIGRPRTVRDARSYTAQEALDARAINGLAGSVDDVLAKADGQIVTRQWGSGHAPHERRHDRDRRGGPDPGDPAPLDDPNIAFVLLVVGAPVRGPGAVPPLARRGPDGRSPARSLLLWLRTACRSTSWA